jgi:outer membrane lipoprotein SlyB
MKLGLSAPQHKKLMSAHKKGKMMTLTMDPYQSQMHGQGLFGDIGNFFSRTVPSTLIHKGLPEAGAVLGGMAGSELGGPMGSIVGSKLGRYGGQKLAEETGRRTGYGVKKGRGSASIAKQMFGRGTPIEDQQFSLSDVASTGKRMFGRGTPIEDQQFSISDVARTGKRLFGGKVHKGKGIMGDLAKMVAPHAKMIAKEVARKAGSKLLHDVLPSASEQLGEMAGDYMGVQGGKQAGKMLGKMLEQEVASRTGLGMKLKRGRPRKLGGALMVAGVR